MIERTVEAVGRTGVRSAVRKKRFKRFLKQKQWMGYLWILPALLLVVAFCYIPPVQALIYSFTDWGFTKELSFVGFENYANVFRDTQFWDAFLNVLLFTACGIVFGNLAAIILSEILYNMKNEKLSAAFRYLFMLSSIVPGVVSILVWEKVIFAPESSSLGGVANSLLKLIGLSGSQWYSSPETIKLTIILTGFPWMGGTSFLIYLAGLQNINPSVIEASKLDGANTLQRIWYFDFPLMSGQLKYFAMTGIIGGLQNYTMQLILANGHSAMVPGYYIYRIGIQQTYIGDLDIYGFQGYACALGIVMFVIIMAITIINNIVMKSGGKEQ